MNVALTRAKCSLYILGKSSALMNSPLWGALIQDARARSVFVPYEESTWKSHRHAHPINLVEDQQSRVEAQLPISKVRVKGECQ